MIKLCMDCLFLEEVGMTESVRGCHKGTCKVKLKHGVLGKSQEAGNRRRETRCLLFL